MMAIKIFLRWKPFPTIVTRVQIQRAHLVVDFKVTTSSEGNNGKLSLRSANWANLGKVKIADIFFHPLSIYVYLVLDTDVLPIPVEGALGMPLVEEAKYQ